MYQIGLFSKMNRITTKTLRHYEKIGLLMPEKTDDFTGYRYYSSNQLPRLNKILTMKQMGLSLKDIKIMIDEPNGVEMYLKLKEEEIQKTIEEDKKRLIRVKSYLNRLKGEVSMKYNPLIKTLEGCIVASMRFIAPNYDSYFEVIPKMGDEMRKLGAVCAEPSYCFNIYHDGEYKEKDIDLEVCEAVVDFCEDSEMIKFKKIKKVDEALWVLHKGPYSLLSDAYTFAFEWIKDNNYEVVGLPREAYIDGIWNKDSEDDWLTEVQIPIVSKTK